MEYKDLFSQSTVDVLKGKSSDNFKKMLGNKSAMKAMMDSMGILKNVMEIERPYRKELEKLAVDMVTEMYPIIEDNDIEIQAQLVDSISLTNENLQLESNENQPEIDDPGDVSKRRIINSITQGGSLNGSFAFYLFKDNLDEINSTLVDQYGDLLKNAYGIYDDDQTIAMMLAMVSRNQQTTGGLSSVKFDEQKGKFVIKAQALCFPILLQEIIKGLYEIISLEGFTGDPEKNKAIVKKADKLTHEPEDIRYGKYIYNALNDLYVDQGYSDPRVREYFLSELYKLGNNEFINFIENLIQDNLTSSQLRWVNDTLEDINQDLKKDDTGLSDLNETNMKLKTLIKEILSEVSMDQIKVQFVDSEKITPEEFEAINQATKGKGAYATWLAKKVADKTIKGEDIYKFEEYLDIFTRRKRDYPYQDINQYKTVKDIEDFIRKSFEIEKQETEDPSAAKGVSKDIKYKELYIGNTDGFNVYKIPKGRNDLYGVSCDLGKGTKWCTATGKTRNWFDSHIKDGPLFIFINPSTGEKYQFQYESNQYKDKLDIDIV